MVGYKGACYCGRLKVTFLTNKNPAKVKFYTVAGFEFCQGRRAIALADPEGRLILHLPAGATQPFQIGSTATDFYVCEQCTAWVAAAGLDSDEAFGIVNLLALHDRAMFALPPTITEFSEEDISGLRRCIWSPAIIIRSGDRENLVSNRAYKLVY